MHIYICTQSTKDFAVLYNELEKWQISGIYIHMYMYVHIFIDINIMNLHI
jgi:hypothetical protein